MHWIMETWPYLVAGLALGVIIGRVDTWLRRREERRNIIPRNLVAALMAERPDDWLEFLVSEYKIDVVRDGDLVSLKYNQIESPMDVPIVKQCRGMVVDTKRRIVLAWPYDKFWNLGESRADPIDWETAKVFEKLDGSLMLLYWSNGPIQPAWWQPIARYRWGKGRWSVASSGHPTAGGSFGAESRTFNQAFWSTFVDLGYRLPPPALRSITLMFELCDNPNRIVVKHDKPRLVLHGARWLETGGEFPYSWLTTAAKMLRWEYVKAFPIGSVEQCVAASEALDPMQQEGYVVVDDAFHRVKVKSPRYVILHHMKGSATPRRAVQLWQTGEAPELLAHFPEFAPIITPVHDRLDAIASQAVQDFYAHHKLPSRKEFALAVKALPHSSVVFKLADGDTVDSAKAIMRRHSLAALERMVGVESQEES